MRVKHNFYDIKISSLWISDQCIEKKKLRLRQISEQHMKIKKLYSIETKSCIIILDKITHE